MSGVSKTVSIKADLQRVLTYIADVRNHPAFIGPLKRVTNLSGDPKDSGTTWDWTFIMAGVELTGKAETIEYVEGKHYKYKTTSGARSTFTYSVESVGQETRLALDVDYDLPESVIGKVAKAVAERMNDRDGDQMTESIKVILED